MDGGGFLTFPNLMSGSEHLGSTSAQSRFGGCGQSRPWFSVMSVNYLQMEDWVEQGGDGRKPFPASGNRGIGGSMG